MLNSKILGVDLEGRLRKGGYIEMVQLNNGVNTFLLDIYRMHLNGDIDCINMSKKVLRHVLCNKKIKKVFHDCRHDSLALHEVMQTCIINIFDTSAIETVRGQL
jgi:ribonuclease D